MAFAPAANAQSPSARFLLLSCIDHRLFASYAERLHKRGLCGQYDHIIFPGAELGALMSESLKQDNRLSVPVVNAPLGPLPDTYGNGWHTAFDEQLTVALALHPHIDTLIIYSHRDCGAYKGFKAHPENCSPETEEAAHEKYRLKLKAFVDSKPAYKARFGDQIEYLLLPVEEVHC